ncbi:acylphosphatase [Ancylobacter radicis]|uniref:acylphosphatase n=1 Tax=Ancylobacter radicis TaxID=2836179 RepID=A0ABS5R4P0_9HYPH|nr:acylphosphatase [Ancylobacter radicis]MBS9476640.1 acylphosphatase [Ancylobacter radicis]
MVETTAVRLFIIGRVQGVGYRAWFAAEARRRGLRGWVRNRRDGRVEALLAEGPDMDAMIEVARHGPPAAHVTQTEISREMVPADMPSGFEVRPTL